MRIVRQLKLKPMKSMKKMSTGWAKRHVFTLKRNATAGRLRKSDLVKNKRGRIVSKISHARGKKNPWIAACEKARKALNIKGFVFFKKGSKLYKKAKEFYNKATRALSIADSCSTSASKIWHRTIHSTSAKHMHLHPTSIIQYD